MQHNRPIRNIAIIGSGIMGSRIACHFANIGVKVLLLDIVPRELTENEIKLGLQLEDKKVRNRIVNEALQSTLKSNPAALYQKNDIRLITTGNIDDDLQQIKECDWILEAVVERLDIKKQLFEKIALHRKVGSIVSSNTSGIPIQMMEQGMSDEMRSNFCGTHFFNPPRYLRLLEIIPGSKTDPKLIDFLVGYGEQFLGKTSVICKDTPAFIANRIGVFSILSLFHLVERLDLGVEEIDKLTGPIVGRPKSATFRTCDVVGLDTLVHVANGLKDHVPNDTRKEIFHLPNYIQQMINSKWFGDKTKQGFYKKSKGEDGKSVILSLNLKTMEYEGKKKNKI